MNQYLHEQILLHLAEQNNGSATTPPAPYKGPSGDDSYSGDDGHSGEPRLLTTLIALFGRPKKQRTYSLALPEARNR
jgi:hypothetical protein